MDETVAQIFYSPRSLELARKLQDPAITTPYWKSRLLSLPVDQLAALVEWLLVDQVTYEEIRLRLWQRFQVHSSLPALSKFWRRRLTPLAITSRALPAAPAKSPQDDLRPVHPANTDKRPPVGLPFAAVTTPVSGHNSVSHPETVARGTPSGKAGTKVRSQ